MLFVDQLYQIANVPFPKTYGELKDILQRMVTLSWGYIHDQCKDTPDMELMKQVTRSVDASWKLVHKQLKENGVEPVFDPEGFRNLLNSKENLKELHF